MIAVATHQRPQMSATILDEFGMVGKIGFAGAIDGALTDDQHADFVGGLIVKFGIGHGVRTHAVDAGIFAGLIPVERILFGLLHKTLIVPGIDAEIEAHTVQEEIPAIDPHLAKAEAGLDTVRALSVHQDFGLERVQMGVLRRPENGVSPEIT